MNASRKRQILSQYPEIKQLFGPDPFAFLKISMVVLLQLWTATFLRDLAWLKILMVAYFFCSFLNHNLFLAIHELSHNLGHSWGWKSFGYLILSTFVGGGMHPMAGHFISEHYVFNPDQETYSYYGPLNLMTWSVGYHNEHHDFPRIPGNKLYKVKEIAPEYYDNLKSYRSWSQVIYMYIMDRTVGPFSRMKRKLSTATTKKSE